MLIPCEVVCQTCFGREIKNNNLIGKIDFNRLLQ